MVDKLVRASMIVPPSMQAELAAWNNGDGIDIESWVGCQGNFSLAIGYASIFWPSFVEFEGYILREGFSENALRSFESQEGQTRQGVEWVMNHLHVADIQYFGCPDVSKDKIIRLGNVLQEIYEAKLSWQFPERPCTVEWHVPKNENDLPHYQISFWQKAHEGQKV